MRRGGKRAAREAGDFALARARSALGGAAVRGLGRQGVKPFPALGTPHFLRRKIPGKNGAVGAKPGATNPSLAQCSCRRDCSRVASLREC